MTRAGTRWARRVPGGVAVTAGYDGYARLTSYSVTGTSLTHSYNGLDDRVATVSGAGTRRFVYDAGGRVLGEYGASATDVKAEYLWLAPEVANDNETFGGDDGTGGYTPLAVASAPAGGSASLVWVHANHLGVPLMTTDATGTEAAPSTAYTALGFPGQTKTLQRLRDFDRDLRARKLRQSGHNYGVTYTLVQRPQTGGPRGAA